MGFWREVTRGYRRRMLWAGIEGGAILAVAVPGSVLFGEHCGAALLIVGTIIVAVFEARHPRATRRPR